MKQFTFFALAILFFMGQSVFSQHTHNGHTRCGTMQHLELLKQQDPSIEERMQQMNEVTQQWIKDNPNYDGSKELLITIPVVVHVIWKTSAQNIPDEQIFSQIDVLNEDFRRLNSDTTNTPDDFLDVAADVEIEFCLASTDPDGEPTDGIVRVETTTTSWSMDNSMKYSSQGGSDAWDSELYLNLWVCNLGGGLLGYAQFPNSGSSATDGVVIGYKYFGYNAPGGYPYNKGRTVTHEVGHWLNLYHIWGDDGGACSGSDLVPDTPNQGGNYWGCPTYPQYSCSSNDMHMNYMDYTDDDCMNIFTAGQKLRMHAAVNSYRPELFDSPGCAGDFLTAAFSANHTEVPADCPVDFTDMSTGDPTSWLWTFEGGDPATSTEQNPTGIEYASTGSYMVTLEVENESGTHTTEMEDYISVGDEYVPEVDFVSDMESFCTNSIVSFTDLSTACPNAWDWTFDPATVTFENGTNANSQNPEVTFNESGVYSVTLQATNVNGEDELMKEDYLYAGGRPVPFVEDFEMGSETIEGWTIDNPDEGTTWEHSEVDGNEPGTHSMSIWFHEEFSVHENDRLVSPVLDLSMADYAMLSFKHAYGQFQSSLSDSLILYASNDCGETWNRIVGFAEDGSGNFATTEPSSDHFYPADDEDWCGFGDNPDCNIMDISNFAGSSNFQLMFETYDLYGNALYLDDIEISIVTSSPALNSDQMQIDLYPVPADDYLYVDIRNVKDFVNIEIMNIQGTIIYQDRLDESGSEIKSTIQMDKMSSGIYFIRLSNSDFAETRKIIVN